MTHGNTCLVSCLKETRAWYRGPMAQKNAWYHVSWKKCLVSCLIGTACLLSCHIEKPWLMCLMKKKA